MRPQPLYHELAARGRRGKLRHLFRTTGEPDFPTSLCRDAQWTLALRPDPAMAVCSECRLIGLTELSLQLDAFGLQAEAIAVATHASDVSYETAAAMSGGA